MKKGAMRVLGGRLISAPIIRPGKTHTQSMMHSRKRKWI